MSENARAVIGGNNPPDPIDETLAPFGDDLTEAEAWLDGKPVETEAQMRAVDALIKAVKAARKAVDTARDEVTKPLHEAWKAEISRWKPTQDDLDRIVKGLVAAVDGFKRKLAEAKAAAERAARQEAERARLAAIEAHRAADASNIEAQRAAAQAEMDAEIAAKKAAIAAKDTVKGLRTVTLYEVTDHRALLHYIARSARDDVTAFVDDWARVNHKAHPNADGLRVWQDKAAF